MPVVELKKLWKIQVTDKEAEFDVEEVHTCTMPSHSPERTHPIQAQSGNITWRGSEPTGSALVCKMFKATVQCHRYSPLCFMHNLPRCATFVSSWMIVLSESQPVFSPLITNLMSNKLDLLTPWVIFLQLKKKKKLQNTMKKKGKKVKSCYLTIWNNTALVEICISLSVSQSGPWGVGGPFVPCIS